MTATLTEPAALPVPAPPAAVRSIDLIEPLPGFPGHTCYALVAADPGGLLFWLQSVAPDGPRFLAVPPAAFFPDYAPVLPRAVCEDLEVAAVGEADLFCLVTVLGDVSTATANLRAPVVVNARTARARQVVLADGGHPIRRPLRR
jgi:flagellar assembly factor FliW